MAVWQNRSTSITQFWCADAGKVVSLNHAAKLVGRRSFISSSKQSLRSTKYMSHAIEQPTTQPAVPDREAFQDQRGRTK